MSQNINPNRQPADDSTQIALQRYFDLHKRFARVEYENEQQAICIQEQQMVIEHLRDLLQAYYRSWEEMMSQGFVTEDIPTRQERARELLQGGDHAKP